MKRILLRSVLFPGLFCLALAGCSGGSGSSLTGTVTLDVAPLSDAKIDFEPYDIENGKGGDTARTNAEGKFTVENSSKKAGLKPGKYKLFISKCVDRRTKQAPPPEEMEMLRSSGLADNLVPAKYSNPEQPPVITVDIKAGKNEPVTWALTK